MQQIPIHELVRDFAAYLRLATTEDIVVTLEGKPLGYIVGFADEDDWVDYLMLHDPDMQAHLRESQQQAHRGEGVSLEEIQARYPLTDS